MNDTIITADSALKKLKDGNLRYLNAKTCGGDISPAIREKTCREGQSPYAIVITCSDSRVIPESIFDCGIGELFVIRVAGNVVNEHVLGSVEYSAGHLGTRLVVVMGHDHCGAVDAALHHDPDGHVKSITDEIKRAVGEETDDYKACCLNVQNSVNIIRGALDTDITVCGAVYHIENGQVEFI